MIEGFIFDLDGTVYLTNRLIDGAKEIVERIRASGRRIVFLSNNPVRTREMYIRKLAAMGIPAKIDDVINSSWVMAEYIRKYHASEWLYVVGESSLKNELRGVGARFASTPEETDIVILAFDRTFHYQKLNFTLRAIRNGASVMATNPDRTCPMQGGAVPDCGALIAAVEAMSGARVDPIVGKPSRIMIETAASAMGVALEKCMLVGDRLETDIAMAAVAGILPGRRRAIHPGPWTSHGRQQAGRLAASAETGSVHGEIPPERHRRSGRDRGRTGGSPQTRHGDAPAAGTREGESAAPRQQRSEAHRSEHASSEPSPHSNPRHPISYEHP